MRTGPIKDYLVEIIVIVIKDPLVRIIVIATKGLLIEIEGIIVA